MLLLSGRSNLARSVHLKDKIISWIFFLLARWGLLPKCSDRWLSTIMEYPAAIWGELTGFQTHFQVQPYLHMSSTFMEYQNVNFAVTICGNGWTFLRFFFTGKTLKSPKNKFISHHFQREKLNLNKHILNKNFSEQNLHLRGSCILKLKLWNSKLKLLYCRVLHVWNPEFCMLFFTVS